MSASPSSTFPPPEPNASQAAVTPVASSVWLGQARHVLTALAGLLVTKGVIEHDAAASIIDNLLIVAGGIVYLIAAWGSWKNKKVQAVEVAVAESMPPPPTR